MKKFDGTLAKYEVKDSTNGKIARISVDMRLDVNEDLSFYGIGVEQFLENDLHLKDGGLSKEIPLLGAKFDLGLKDPEKKKSEHDFEFILLKSAKVTYKALDEDPETPRTPILTVSFVVDADTELNSWLFAFLGQFVQLVMTCKDLPQASLDFSNSNGDKEMSPDAKKMGKDLDKQTEDLNKKLEKKAA